MSTPIYSGSYYQYYGANYAPTTSVVPTAQVVRTAPVSTATSDGLIFQNRAEQAFRDGDFDLAARMASHALVEMPRDGKLYLFASQTLFAVGDYRGAAAAIHQAASLLDSREWGYVVENYARYYRGRGYVEQMERLNEFVMKNPDASYAYFLRGYHQGFLGRKEVAVRELNKSLEIEGRDDLAARLVERFGGVVNPKAAPDVPDAGRELRARPIDDVLPPAPLEAAPREVSPLSPPAG